MFSDQSMTHQINLRIMTSESCVNIHPIYTLLAWTILVIATVRILLELIPALVTLAILGTEFHAQIETNVPQVYIVVI